MDCLTNPERKIIRILLNEELSINDLAKKIQLDHFIVQKILDRLMKYDFLNLNLGIFSIKPLKKNNLIQLLNQEHHKRIESGEILQTLVESNFNSKKNISQNFKNPDYLKIQSLQCKDYELRVLQNHFEAIEKIIQEIKIKNFNNNGEFLAKKDKKSIFVLYGFHMESTHWEITKKNYLKGSNL